MADAVDRTGYDDFFAWSQEQAAVLRRLAARRDLPNDLDLAHIAEEIEDVGRSELHSVQSYIRLTLVHLIEAARVNDDGLRAHRRSEIVSFRNDLLTRYTPSMRQRIDLDLLWKRALEEAEARLAAYGQPGLANAPATCPLPLDAFLAERFDFERALKAMMAAVDRGSASGGGTPGREP